MDREKQAFLAGVIRQCKRANMDDADTAQIIDLLFMNPVDGGQIAHQIKSAASGNIDTTLRKRLADQQAGTSTGTDAAGVSIPQAGRQKAESAEADFTSPENQLEGFQDPDEVSYNGIRDYAGQLEGFQDPDEVDISGIKPRDYASQLEGFQDPEEAEANYAGTGPEIDRSRATATRTDEQSAATKAQTEADIRADRLGEARRLMPKGLGWTPEQHVTSEDRARSSRERKQYLKKLQRSMGWYRSSDMRSSDINPNMATDPEHRRELETIKKELQRYEQEQAAMGGSRAGSATMGSGFDSRGSRAARGRGSRAVRGGGRAAPRATGGMWGGYTGRPGDRVPGENVNPNISPEVMLARAEREGASVSSSDMDKLYAQSGTTPNTAKLDVQDMPGGTFEGGGNSQRGLIAFGSKPGTAMTGVVGNNPMDPVNEEIEAYRRKVIASGRPLDQNDFKHIQSLKAQRFNTAQGNRAPRPVTPTAPTARDQVNKQRTMPMDIAVPPVLEPKVDMPTLSTESQADLEEEGARGFGLNQVTEEPDAGTGTVGAPAVGGGNFERVQSPFETPELSRESRSGLEAEGAAAFGLDELAGGEIEPSADASTIGVPGVGGGAFGSLNRLSPQRNGVQTSLTLAAGGSTPTTAPPPMSAVGDTRNVDAFGGRTGTGTAQSTDTGFSGSALAGVDVDMGAPPKMPGGGTVPKGSVPGGGVAMNPRSLDKFFKKRQSLLVDEFIKGDLFKKIAGVAPRPLAGSSGLSFQGTVGNPTPNRAAQVNQQIHGIPKQQRQMPTAENAGVNMPQAQRQPAQMPVDQRNTAYNRLDQQVQQGRQAYGPPVADGSASATYSQTQYAPGSYAAAISRSTPVVSKKEWDEWGLESANAARPMPITDDIGRIVGYQQSAAAKWQNDPVRKHVAQQKALRDQENAKIKQDIAAGRDTRSYEALGQTDPYFAEKAKKMQGMVGGLDEAGQAAYEAAGLKGDSARNAWLQGRQSAMDVAQKTGVGSKLYGIPDSAAHTALAPEPMSEERRNAARERLSKMRDPVGYAPMQVQSEKDWMRENTPQTYRNIHEADQVKAEQEAEATARAEELAKAQEYNQFIYDQRKREREDAQRARAAGDGVVPFMNDMRLAMSDSLENFPEMVAALADPNYGTKDHSAGRQAAGRIAGHTAMLPAGGAHLALDAPELMGQGLDYLGLMPESWKANLDYGQSNKTDFDVQKKLVSKGGKTIKRFAKPVDYASKIWNSLEPNQGMQGYGDYGPTDASRIQDTMASGLYDTPAPPEQALAADTTGEPNAG